MDLTELRDARESSCGHVTHRKRQFEPRRSQRTRRDPNPLAFPPRPLRPPRLMLFHICGPGEAVTPPPTSRSIPDILEEPKENGAASTGRPVHPPIPPRA